MHAVSYTIQANPRLFRKAEHLKSTLLITYVLVLLQKSWLLRKSKKYVCNEWTNQVWHSEWRCQPPYHYFNNHFQTCIRIFSSRPFQLVSIIKSDLAPSVTKSLILIAHLAIHGTDHYDAVKKKMQSVEKEYKVWKSNFSDMEDQLEDADEQISIFQFKSRQ